MLCWQHFIQDLGIDATQLTQRIRDVETYRAQAQALEDADKRASQYRDENKKTQGQQGHLSGTDRSTVPIPLPHSHLVSRPTCDSHPFAQSP